MSAVNILWLSDRLSYWEMNLYLEEKWRPKNTGSLEIRKASNLMGTYLKLHILGHPQ